MARNNESNKGNGCLLMFLGMCFALVGVALAEWYWWVIAVALCIVGIVLAVDEESATTTAGTKLRETLSKAVANKDKNFGNARYVRNLFEKTLENQARRLASVSELSEDVLAEIKAEDIPEYD